MHGEKKVDIGGKKRLIKFGTNATALFCDEYDMSLSEFSQLEFDKMKPGQMRDLIWAGLVSGAYKSGEDTGIDKMQVGDWIDDAPQERIEEIVSVLSGPDSKKKSKAAP